MTVPEKHEPKLKSTPEARDVTRGMAMVLVAVFAAITVVALQVTVPARVWLSALAVGGVIGFLAIWRHYGILAELREWLRRRTEAARPEQAAAPSDPLQTLMEGPGTTSDLAVEVSRLFQRLDGRRQEIEATVASQERVIESLPAPVLILDERGRVEKANAAAQRQFGDRMIGREVSTILRHPDLIATVDAVREGEARAEAEITLADQTVLVRLQRVPRGDDQPPGAVLLIEDLTEIRRAGQMRVDFVANVSHELRTPLTTLIGFIETLRGPARDDAEARVRFLEVMDGQARRMARLVNDLLSLSQIETKEHKAPDKDVSVAEVIGDVVTTLEIEARRKNMPIRQEIEDDLPLVVGDPDEISQIVQNLLENAVKYGRADTPVDIKVACDPDPPPGYPARDRTAVALSVTDRGEGIEREHLPRLTERFYRVDTDRSRALGGTGLGLAIVKHIVGRHRGSFTVDSSVGVGSTFTIHLPSTKPLGSDQPVSSAASELSDRID